MGTKKAGGALQEREKELDALYALADLLISPPGSTERFLGRAAEILAAAFQDAGRVKIHIRYGKVETGGSRPGAAEKHVLRAGIPSDEMPKGVIEVFYPGSTAPETPFLGREKLLLTSIANLLYAALRRFRAEARSRRRNAALREILYRFEGENRLLVRRIRQALEREVLVPLRKEPSLKSWAELLGTTLGNLRDLVEPGRREVYEDLSPREIEICRFIRGGLTTKEIARTLGLSELTVERHRHHIRQKLALEKDTALASYLLANP